MCPRNTRKTRKRDQVGFPSWSDAGTERATRREHEVSNQCKEESFWIFYFFRVVRVFRGRLSSHHGILISWIATAGVGMSAWGATSGPVDVPAQPLAANVARLVEALEMLGTPLAVEVTAALKRAGES